MEEVKIEYTSKFTKQYKKLAPKIQTRFLERQRLFITKPTNPQLHDHALVGKYQGYRSINITGDIQALYIKRGDIIIIFAFIGSHSQLY